jgi:threonyl-tRNA synthetase
MSKIKLEFPDKSIKEYEEGITGLDLAKEISEGLGRAALAIKINNKLTEVTTPITTSGTFQIITFKDPEGVEVFRHSTAHLLAHAIVELFPFAKLTIGPVVEEGFYYDIDHKPFTPEDLKKIEAKMKELASEKIPIIREEISKEKALEICKDNEFKIEMINELEEGTITIYKQGNFIDLCRGPHVPHTGYIKSFKLTKLAGAYWRGDAKNKQLQRIYGISFPDKKELRTYLHRIEEAKKRDHRILGKRLGLFSFHEEGPGLPFFKNNGMAIWHELITYWKDIHNKWDYEEIKTPIMLSKELWEKSGHWTNYKDNMYTTKIDDQEFAIKPMNCPGGMLEYKETIHSYRELPLRCGEIGLVHRHELSGALSGLFRVRCFHQDDAHIFMTEDQIKDEILGVLKVAEEMYAKFGLDFHLELSTKPEKAIGTKEAWEISTNGLKAALEECGKDYVINEGDGAFYGPKIDLHIKDAIGRTWQCGTIQLDMNLPERFDLTYEGADGNKHRPVMIHRVIYGSMERFFGILVEHYAGKFPTWLSPIQARILPIADRHVDYAKKIALEMKASGIRAKVDDRAESTNKKVREAQLDFIPYILVVGDKEQENNSVNIRTRDNVVHGEKPVTEFIKTTIEEIKERK